MAYRFKRKESVSESIRRIAAKCIDKALKNCKEQQLESVHSARKEIKKLRALLRLVKSEIGNQAFECSMARLKKAAGYLAPIRDAHVKACAFEMLIQSRRSGSLRTRLENIGGALRKNCEHQLICFRENERGKIVRGLLREEAASFKKLSLNSDGWAAIGSGVEKSYRAARSAGKRAETKPTAENFHEWRKRIKDLLYAVQLLRPIWPEQMSATIADLEKLAELIGEDYDLHMLEQSAIKESVKAEFESEGHELLDLADQRRRQLQTDALKFGRGFFHEKPSVFCHRLHQYWKLWKSKKNPRKRSSDLSSARSKKAKP
jgi:CHAD domain-containing protein